MAKEYFWLDGKFVESSKATVPILTHSLQYGSGIFEGIRAYKAKDGTAIFRLEDHVKRFFSSAAIYSMDLQYTKEDIANAIIGLVRKNKMSSCYIRPFAFYNDQRIGLSVKDKKISIAIAAVNFGSYFKNKSSGISCVVSSWRRINSSTLPPMAKASGNYVNSILASSEAAAAGADEAILLNTAGHVAEGPGENIFLVEHNVLITPSKSSDILIGITRDSVIKLAEAVGLEVEERDVNREELYTCSEAFFSGTAAEITPITSIDFRKIGKGSAGPITKTIAEDYSSATVGTLNEGFEDWLTYL